MHRPDRRHSTKAPLPTRRDRTAALWLLIAAAVGGAGAVGRDARAQQPLSAATGSIGSATAPGGMPLQAPPQTIAPLQSQMQSQPVELATLQVERNDGALNLEFAVRINLPRAVDDALHRGVPLYFVAEAQLLRNRWYWRDERVSRIQRSWRVAYQPLTNTWRVGLGGLNQTHATLAESLAAVSRSSGWRLADLSQLDPDRTYYVDFRFRLDTSQLPGPMQFGLGSQGEWAVEASRVLKVDL